MIIQTLTLLSAGLILMALFVLAKDDRAFGNRQYTFLMLMIINELLLLSHLVVKLV